MFYIHEVEQKLTHFAQYNAAFKSHLACVSFKFDNQMSLEPHSSTFLPKSLHLFWLDRRNHDRAQPQYQIKRPGKVLLLKEKGRHYEIR